MRVLLLVGVSLLALSGCGTTPPMTSEDPRPRLAAPALTEDVDVPANVLLADWQGEYDGVPPFDRVTPSMFPEAIQFGVDERKREIASIINNPSPATFQNTIEPLERTGARLGRVLSVFDVMTSNMATPAYQALEKEWSPKLSQASDEITLNADLFARIKAVYDGLSSASLDEKQRRLVSRIYMDYVRSGANLAPEGKKQLSAYNSQLAEKFAVFSEKVLADESTYVGASASQLRGVPADVQAAAKSAARSLDLPSGSFAIVNTRSAVDPILTFADDRALREKVWRAFVSRGENGDANDTNAIIADIVKLRAQRAKLLGFASHAEWRMQDTMAGSPAKAQDSMMRVWPAAVARVKEEVRDQQKIAGPSLAIERWDYRYYQEKVRQKRYNLSQEEVKPYFALDNIIEASYWAAGELYGLDFKEITGTVPTWNSDVRVYSVTARNDGRQVGVFYRDDYARAGKRSGAWADAYRSRVGLTGDKIVLSSNNNNFVKAAAGQPVLISLDDAETLFHEFGHAIHYFLTDVYYPGLLETPRDFVEYPSQVNENWLLTREVLSRFAKHYKTGQPMPKSLLARIDASSKFNQGFATVEYLASALTDMALHTQSDGTIDPKKFEKETLASLGMPKQIAMRHRLPHFNHLFSSDSYSAGYYSYLWSETMDADTWAAFEQSGNPFDKATANRFRTTLLSTGNETDRAEAYRAFRGRDPDVTELLRKRGFPTGKK